jgi:hypothetical protein
MKKLILISSGISFFLLLIVTALASVEAETHDTIKRSLSPEQLQMIKQRIKSPQDSVRLDPEGKGSFDWWGWLDWMGELAGCTIRT